MKTVKRISAIILSLVLMLSMLPALALAEEGTYLETIVDLPEGYGEFTGLISLPDGSLAMAARNESESWDLLIWADLNGAPSVSPLGFEGELIYKLDAAPDGSLAIVSYSIPSQIGNGPEGGDAQEEAVQNEAIQSEAVQGENPQVGTRQQGNKIMGGGSGVNARMYLLAPDYGVVGSFELDDMPFAISALSGQKAAVLGMGSGIMVYDAQGGVLWQIGGDLFINLASGGDALYIYSADGILTSYDIQTGQKQTTVELGSSNTSKTLAVSGETVYLMDETGLYALEGQDLSKRMDGVGTFFGDPGNGISGLAILEDGTVATLISEGTGSYGSTGVRIGIGGDNKNIFAVYSPVDPSTVAEKKDFTITALRTSAALRKAVSDFQRKHPELNVILDAKMAEDAESGADDAIRALNTELLAGKGGDVLILDGLPLDKYIEKGILSDLTDVLSGINFLPGVKEGSTASDGKLYAMPAEFSFETLWGDASVIEMLSSLDKLSETPLSSGQTILNPRSPEDWIRLFYPASESSFRDDQGKLSFDTPEFEQFLELIYQLYASQGEDPSDNMEYAAGGMAQAEIQAMLNGAAALYPTTASNLTELNVAYTITGAKNSGFTTVPSLDGLSLGYTPKLLAGINARSANLEAAQEFILTLFSKDVQELDQANGLPVVAESLDKLIEDAIERSTSDNIKMMISFDGSNPIEIVFPDEQTLTELRALCDTLSYPITADETLLGFIIDETESFFKGQVGAQAAAQAVQQRAWTYLNE